MNATLKMSGELSVLLHAWHGSFERQEGLWVLLQCNSLESSIAPGFDVRCLIIWSAGEFG